MSMSTSDSEETQFKQLKEKFAQELAEIEKHIEYLNDRATFLTSLLYDNVVLDEKPIMDPDEPLGDQLDIDHEIFMFLQSNPGTGRKRILDYLVAYGRDADTNQVKRALERCKRRGLVTNRGSGRGSVWYALTENKKTEK